MKPTDSHHRYQFKCPRCKLYFWTDRAEWEGGKQCPDCDDRDKRKKYQKEARAKWWSQNAHLKEAVFEDVYVDAGAIDVLYLRTTDAALWKAYIKRGWEANEAEIIFEKVTEENTLLIDD